MEKIACDVCGSTSVSVVFEKEDKGVWARILRCSKCSFTFIHPHTVEGRELESFYHDNPAYGEKDLIRLKERSRRLQMPLGKLVLKECYGYPFNDGRKNSAYTKFLAYACKPFLLKNVFPFRGEGRILDIGCDRGLFLAQLKEIGWRVWGVEINPYSCEHAKKLGINMFCGQLEDAQFPSRHFDVVRIVHVIEHMESPARILREIRRILKPEGIIYLETPNQNSLASRCFKERWLKVGVHICAFSPRTLQFLCSRLGLRMRKIRFKSGKGITIKSLQYFWQDHMGFFPFPESVFKNKLIQTIIINPFRFLLNLLHRGDAFSAEIIQT